MTTDLWTVLEETFDPARQAHAETVFTIGNGYLATRGACEECYPGERRATFVHGVFDAAPVVFTELANAPDWLPLSVYVDGERFALDCGTVHDYRRALDLRSGALTRAVRWESPGGRAARITFERCTSLADEHLLLLRCRVVPEFAGTLEFRAALHGATDNEGLAHWRRLAQGRAGDAVYLHSRTRTSGIDLACAMRVITHGAPELGREFWDAENAPTLVVRLAAEPGREAVVEKLVAVYTSRDVEAARTVPVAVECAQACRGWDAAYPAHAAAWAEEWARTDVVVEGDDEVQLALRFNLFQLLVAAPRRDERVNIGAKTLSGFGYRGHAFWDTEIFMLPLFIFTAPHIARNLLSYRYHTLAAARRKALAGGYAGAQFAWESADTGDEVTPRWVPDSADPAQLVRIWPGDIEIHISADVAYMAHRYWQITGDDAWFVARGAELILDTARFWASRAERHPETGRYEYRDVIGPDEYHDHVDNNHFTNRMARWNLETALQVLEWLQAHAPARAAELLAALELTPATLAHWHDVIARLYLPVTPSGLIEQFTGYFARRDIDLAALEPRTQSAQAIFGIAGANETQVIKQPDVLMLLYLLRDCYTNEAVRANYNYYTPRTDHTYGSSLGPSIQAIMACEVGRVDEAYEHFLRAVRADLRDVRGNAGDGIHGASAGGTWQAVVFGFAGLRVDADGWTVNPRLPGHWTRLAFKFYWRGRQVVIDLPGQQAAGGRQQAAGTGASPERGILS